MPRAPADTRSAQIASAGTARVSPELHAVPFESRVGAWDDRQRGGGPAATDAYAMQLAFECQQCRALCAVFVERWQHQHVHDAAPQRVELWQDELPQANPVRVPVIAGIEQQRARMGDDQRGRTTPGVKDAHARSARLGIGRWHEQQRKRHADGGQPKRPRPAAQKHHARQRREGNPPRRRRCTPQRELAVGSPHETWPAKS